MSSFRGRREETEGHHARTWNLAGLNPGFTAHDLSFDQHSLFTVEDFDHDVDQSVVSSNGWDTNNNATFVSPPTSTYSHSNPGDYSNTTCNQYYTTDPTYKWGCDQAITDYDIGGDGQCSLTIDPQLDLGAVFTDDFTYSGSGPSAPSVDQTNYLDPSRFLGEAMDFGSIGPDPETTRLGPPRITVEDTGGGMGPWLNGMYTPGLGTANNNIAPQRGLVSGSAATLDASSALPRYEKAHVPNLRERTRKLMPGRWLRNRYGQEGQLEEACPEQASGVRLRCLGGYLLMRAGGGVEIPA
ncbi:uncharacterized protein BKCO1_12000106 [Diplodia corticola]|uniref:Uncharacterized protein n=1 Tax=Diplodia corticola TaxID=236234 RepID=A0A1J9S8K4_9PEZI|nr:uncharacterized protein BKCO1_12000106 [Diplodia corticola]OJD36244.1 hypothetical protein BKCO1_12000106 [Diplodia corticola]